MSQERVMELFKSTGAYLDGHFLLTSGLHSPAYVEKFRLLEQPKACDEIAGLMAAPFKNDKIDLVLGPALGGIILAYAIGRALGTRGIFMERENGKLTLRRDFFIGAQERVLVVEDVVTTGSSVFELLAEIPKEMAEGRVAGVAYLVDRSGGKVDFKVKQAPLLKLDLPTYKPEDCPLCAKGIALTKRGSRKL